jgi:hypothetical protein
MTLVLLFCTWFSVASLMAAICRVASYGQETWDLLDG